MRLIDKIKKMGSLLILSTCCLTSCNFLDVVPPEQAGLGDAVKKPESTLGFLYSCYAGIKGSSNPITYTGMEAASTDEFVFPELWGHSGQRAGWGLLTPESPGDWLSPDVPEPPPEFPVSPPGCVPGVVLLLEFPPVLVCPL